MPDRAVFDESYWEAYKFVNHKFATSTLQALRNIKKVKIEKLLSLNYHKLKFRINNKLKKNCKKDVI